MSQSQTTGRIDIPWFTEQVETYKNVEKPKYDSYAEVLKKLLEHALRRLAPHALVQARAKTLPSFAEKILRKRDKYRNPVHQLTDLCGARVVTHTKAEVESICNFIKTHFVLDEKNSLDTVALLRAREFGYRAVHYIVQIKTETFPTDDGPVNIPDDVRGLKAEIQVRTIAQHCWADIGHDRLYKSTFKVPEHWERESARAAALLENVDDAFSRVVQGLGIYQTGFGAYMDPQRMREEIEMLETVYRCDAGVAGAAQPANNVWSDGDKLDLAHRIARLAIGLEDWAKVIDVVGPVAGAQMARAAPLLFCRGFARCQQHERDRQSVGFKEGQADLENAHDAAPHDIDVLATLADTWIGFDEDKAFDSYEKAFSLDPTNPRALSGYVIGKIAREKDLSFVSVIRPILEAAISRCQDHAQARVNLPWAYYRIGEFNLLLRRPFDSLAAYTKAIQLSNAAFMIENALKIVERLNSVSESLAEQEWVRRLLLLAHAAKFRGGELDPHLRSLLEPNGKTIKEPVFIVAGGCNPALQQQMETYRQVLLAGLADFQGTIISGGTREGISGLVGELAERQRPKIRAIGYLPRAIPFDATRDDRYEHRVTDGAPADKFSPIQPLQSWIDMIASGIHPGKVKLYGINGGDIAGFEYRLALALGAQVKVVDDSGREANRLATDADWKTVRNLELLFGDKVALKNFAVTHRDSLARRIHEEYLSHQRGELAKQRPALNEWETLPDNLKESNRRQAEDIERKLQAVGIRVYAVNDREISLLEFTAVEVEESAKMEHKRWCDEKRQADWRPGSPRDDEKKIHPCLVSWEQLPEGEREKDRNAVRVIPKLLKEIGLELRRA